MPQTDPIVAAALFAAWFGDPAVVLASPPGAGKTRLVVHLAKQLHRRAQLKIAIAAQTRSQALDVANRTAAIGGRVGLLGARSPSGLKVSISALCTCRVSPSFARGAGSWWPPPRAGSG